MDAISTDPTDKEDRTDDKPKLQDSLVLPSDSITSQTEPLTQATSLSELTSTDDTQVSPAETLMNVFPMSTLGEVPGPVSTSSPCSVETDQPKPQCALQPPFVEVCSIYEDKQQFSSISQGEDSLKTMTVHTEPDTEDLCAAILLACLFCHPLDCVLSMMRGCNECLWSLCSFLCGCEPSTLQPLMDITSHCGCLGVQCCQCECHICDICLQATECLDLAMEISQMLYH